MRLNRKAISITLLAIIGLAVGATAWLGASHFVENKGSEGNKPPMPKTYSITTDGYTMNCGYEDVWFGVPQRTFVSFEDSILITTTAFTTETYQLLNYQQHLDEELGWHIDMTVSVQEDYTLHLTAYDSVLVGKWAGPEVTGECKILLDATNKSREPVIPDNQPRNRFSPQPHQRTQRAGVSVKNILQQRN